MSCLNSGTVKQIALVCANKNNIWHAHTRLEILHALFQDGKPWQRIRKYDLPSLGTVPTSYKSRIQLESIAAFQSSFIAFFFFGGGNTIKKRQTCTWLIKNKQPRQKKKKKNRIHLSLHYIWHGHVSHLRRIFISSLNVVISGQIFHSVAICSWTHPDVIMTSYVSCFLFNPAVLSPHIAIISRN